VRSTYLSHTHGSQNLATGKIGVDELMTVEGARSVVVKHFASSDGCSERECWVRNRVFINLFEHPHFFR